jgi:hypothetical protein
MDITITNFEWTKTKAKGRLKATMDIDLKGLLFKNCCLFMREDGSRYLRLPVRELAIKGKPPIYSEMVEIVDKQKRVQFHREALRALDRYLAQQQMAANN